MSEFEFDAIDNLCEFCIHKGKCKYSKDEIGEEECKLHKMY